MPVFQSCKPRRRTPDARTRRTPRWRALAFGALVALPTLTYPLELSDGLLKLVEERFGAPARERMNRWVELARLGKAATDDRRLQMVNTFFNGVPFRSDLEHWGQEDYWATPVELLATHGGDCEDYSIAKFLTLKAMGIDEDKLRITYVKAIELNQAHMVLAYYPTPDADPLILDNLINDILPASRRTDLSPVYSFNGSGLWLNKLQGQSTRVGDATRISRWADLNNRLLDSLR